MGRKPRRCGRCDRPFKTGEDRLHSDWSGLSYCFEIDACGRRAKKFADRPEIIWVSNRGR